MAMQVTIDQQPCDVGADSVWAAIAEASAIAQSKGRLIVEVVLDGTPLTDEEVGALEEAQRAADTIELTTANVSALVAEVFAEADDALGQAESLQKEAAEHLQAGAQSEAMAKLGEAISIWQSAQRAFELGVTALADGPKEMKTDSFEAAAARLRQQLDSVCESLRQRDMIALADALLYELPDCVAQWRTMLRTLREAALQDETK